MLKRFSGLTLSFVLFHGISLPLVAAGSAADPMGMEVEGKMPARQEAEPANRMASTPLGEDLQGLLDYAKEHSPQYAVGQYEVDAALQRVTPAGALPDPRFRMELQDITRSGDQFPSLLPSRVGSTRYQLMQELPWFGKRDLQRQVAMLEAESSKGELRETWTELSTRIKVIHAERYYLHRNELLLKEILDLMVRLEAVARERYARGLTSHHDAIRAQTEQTILKTELVALQIEQQPALDARMNALLGRPTTAVLAPPTDLRAMPPVEKLDYAILEVPVRERNPSLYTAEQQVKVAEKRRLLTHKKRFPDIAVGGGPMQEQGNFEKWELMLEMTIPLQRSSLRAQESEAESMLLAARSREEAVVQQLLAELAENLAALHSALQIERLAYTSLLPQAELTYGSALVAYEAGQVDFGTLLDAQRQIRQARQNQLRAHTDAVMRIAEIEQLLGDEI